MRLWEDDQMMEKKKEKRCGLQWRVGPRTGLKGKTGSQQET